MSDRKKLLKVVYINKRRCVIDFNGKEDDFDAFVKKHFEDPEIEFDTSDGITLVISPADIPDLLFHYDVLLERQ